MHSGRIEPGETELGVTMSGKLNEGLARQSLRRPLTEGEVRLAQGLEQIFRGGVTDFAQVTVLLQQNGVQPPSGATGPWSPELLQSELARINGSLDDAYLKRG